VPEPGGVAVQARLYAEDARRGFLPSTGRVAVFEVPGPVRVDAGVAAGCEITPHYDPMIAKLIAHAPDRAAALGQLRGALTGTTVLGVTSNRAFLHELLGDEAVRANAVGTEFIDGWLAQHVEAEVAPEDVAVMAALWLTHQRPRTPGPRVGSWADPALTGWRLHRGTAASLQPHALRAVGASGEWRVGFGNAREALAVRVEDETFHVALPGPGDPFPTVAIDGRRLHLRGSCRGTHVHARIGDRELSLDLQPLHEAGRGSSTALHGLVRAPMMGIMVTVDATSGQPVAAGQRLATLESMKMEMAITAPAAGTVTWVGCQPQGKVERHQELFRIEPTA
jgi:acetyl/propionyl-CoA carboxylase alpha subunit